MLRMLALAVALAACEGPEEEAGGTEPRRRMTGEVADLLERRCTSCHEDSLAGPAGLSSRPYARTHGLLTLEEAARFQRWMAGSAGEAVCSWGQHGPSAASARPASTRSFLRPDLRCTACPFEHRTPRLELPPPPQPDHWI